MPRHIRVLHSVRRQSRRCFPPRTRAGYAAWAACRMHPSRLNHHHPTQQSQHTPRVQTPLRMEQRAERATKHFAYRHRCRRRRTWHAPLAACRRCYRFCGSIGGDRTWPRPRGRERERERRAPPRRAPSEAVGGRQQQHQHQQQPEHQQHQQRRGVPTSSRAQLTEASAVNGGASISVR